LLMIQGIGHTLGSLDIPLFPKVPTTNFLFEKCQKNIFHNFSTFFFCSRKNRFYYYLISLVPISIFQRKMQNLKSIYTSYLTWGSESPTKFVCCAFFKFSAGFKYDFIKEKEKVHLALG
ncbi:hypothetical protein ACJX0J_016412, partial [Zea mays]